MKPKKGEIVHIGVPRGARGAREKRAAAWLSGAYYRGPTRPRAEQQPIPVRDENGVLPEPVVAAVQVKPASIVTTGIFTARSYLARTGE